MSRLCSGEAYADLFVGIIHVIAEFSPGKHHSIVLHFQDFETKNNYARLNAPKNNYKRLKTLSVLNYKREPKNKLMELLKITKF